MVSIGRIQHRDSWTDQGATEKVDIVGQPFAIPAFAFAELFCRSNFLLSLSDHGLHRIHLRRLREYAAALASALFAITGAVFAGHPRWLREQDEPWTYFGCVQCLLGLVILSTGGYLADHVHGFQTSFEVFSGDDNFHYYNVMYYGGVGRAAYGSLVIFMAVAPFIAIFLSLISGRESFKRDAFSRL